MNKKQQTKTTAQNKDNKTKCPISNGKYLGPKRIRPSLTLTRETRSSLRSLKDGAATSLPPRPTTSTTPTPWHGQRKTTIIWERKGITPQADEQEPTEETSIGQQHLKTNDQIKQPKEKTIRTESNTIPPRYGGTRRRFSRR